MASDFTTSRDSTKSDAEADRLSIAETLRIMDVASSLRRERDLVEREFAFDEFKQGLRERLRAVAETTGEPVTEAEIEAAIDWYHRNLHVYEPPRPGLRLFVAHAWVRRRTVLGWAILAALVALVVWWSW